MSAQPPNKKRKVASTLLIAGVLILAVILLWPRPKQVTLTGIVTTDEIVVGPEIEGRVDRLLVREGDSVTNGQLLAVIRPEEKRAEVDFYAQSQRQSKSDVARAEADLKYQEAQTSNQIWQAEATLASTQDQVTQGEADLENATLTFQRESDLYHRGVDSVQAYDQARTSVAAHKARVDSLRKQVIAAQAAVGLAKASADQIESRRAALAGMEHQLAAAGAQADMAQVRLDYTEVRAPTNGIVNVRAALQGEVVTVGQAIVTLINPDDLWVRADLEESYVPLVRLGDTLDVRLPSGEVRKGTVFFRGVDADYATQRDVSRTKRDIKTFEIRVRCDNHDRALAVGMTSFVSVPLEKR